MRTCACLHKSPLRAAQRSRTSVSSCIAIPCPLPSAPFLAPQSHARGALAAPARARAGLSARGAEPSGASGRE
eukprot:7161273-Alexandrium_andersonii.AAC.1